MLVIAPTSRARTWSIMGGADVDAEGLRQMVEFVAERHALDRSRVLLTGMSDGATYALLCGLRDGMPFTHLAPECGALHPLLLVDGGIARAQGRPIYLVHGALDWMFPVQTARLARDVLLSAGARLVYREIADLSHTYPRDENAAILDWLVGA
jgi:phospholipase/carboxylesterase